MSIVERESASRLPGTHEAEKEYTVDDDGYRRGQASLNLYNTHRRAIPRSESISPQHSKSLEYIRLFD